jgi:hypothetical protein
MAVAAALAAVHTKREQDHEHALSLHAPALARANRPSGANLLDGEALSESAPNSRWPGVGDEEAHGGRSSARVFPHPQPLHKGNSQDRRSSVDLLHEKHLQSQEKVVVKALRRWSARWVQARLRRVYEMRSVQLMVASLIAFNFLVSVVQAQIAQDVSEAQARVFDGFELFFNVAFSLELLWNMAANWLLAFWGSGWNVFDFFIVIIAWLSVALENLPGVTVLRLFRAFRVFRLFRRVESLRSIIEGVLASLPAVANAFVVMGILMGIWSIIGVDSFGEYADEEFGTFLRVSARRIARLGWAGLGRLDGLALRPASAAAAVCARIALSSRLPSRPGGPARTRPYVCLSVCLCLCLSLTASLTVRAQALLTMWQIMTLDGWTEVARPIIFYSSQANLLAAPVFFVSYTFVAAIVMSNVVIAILLDNVCALGPAAAAASSAAAAASDAAAATTGELHVCGCDCAEQS